jgi:hypothetical protein
MAKKPSRSTREQSQKRENTARDRDMPAMREREPVGGGGPWPERGRGAGEPEPGISSARLRPMMPSGGLQRAPGPFPLDNLTYDLITVLHEKSKGLEAFEKYLEHARDDYDLRLTLEDIREQDERAIAELRDHLYRIIMQRRGLAA